MFLVLWFTFSPERRSGSAGTDRVCGRGDDFICPVTFEFSFGISTQGSKSKAKFVDTFYCKNVGGEIGAIRLYAKFDESCE